MKMTYWFCLSLMAPCVLVQAGVPTQPVPAGAAQSRTSGSPSAARAWAVQEKFATSPHAKEFADWQDRFSAELRYALEDLQVANPVQDAIKKLTDDDSDEQALALLFPHSIADTPKGRSLKRYIVDGWKHGRADHSKLPIATIFIRQVLGNPYFEPGASTTKAVGYGGVIVDGDYRTESLYILPAELDSLKPGSTDRSKRYQDAIDGLAALDLPAYGVSKRNVWPMLMFVRAPDGKLMLYAMTQEMHTISERLYQRQPQFNF